MLDQDGHPRLEGKVPRSEDHSPVRSSIDRDSSYYVLPSLAPHSMRDALRSMSNGKAMSEASGSGATSEEDYDDMTAPQRPPAQSKKQNGDAVVAEPSELRRRNKHAHRNSDSSLPELPGLRTGTSSPGYILSANERELARKGVQRVSSGSLKRGKFSDLVFTRKFSAFDRQNEDAANSPFHGFFTLFWTCVLLFMLKIGADNWKDHGNPLGTNEIMRTMFRRDILVLFVADGVMCALASESWVLQKAIAAGYLDWDGAGIIIQNIWQALYISGVIGVTMVREWPWTHTVFFVLHGLVFLMKQHSYSFYNGYLSTVLKEREMLVAQLKQLEGISPVQSPSTTGPQVSSLSTLHLALEPSAQEWKERRKSIVQENTVPDTDKIIAAIDSGKPLDESQVHVFERLIQWEIDGLTDELKGKASSPSRAYPNRLTFTNFGEYIMLPTVVYELEYPRSERINWYYVAEKLVACFGIIFVMIMISQTFIYPVVMQTVYMKETGMPLGERFQAFPWMLADLVFPFLMEYLMSWYLIWETILNLLAELTYFADRNFYGAWWNSVSWDGFARDWNRPVHNFLLRHVYHSSISAMKVNKHTATLITFFLSACVHELVMWCIFKKLRGYLLMLQMFQIPLVRMSRTKWLRNRQTLGNIMFWMGLLMGPSMLCSLYLIL